MNFSSKSVLKFKLRAKAFAVIAFTIASLIVQGTAWAQERIFAFAADNNLTMFVGKWDPKRHWVAPEAFYQPPAPQAPVTLYNTTGKVGEVVIADDRSSPRGGTPQEWSASITRWDQSHGEYALAILGTWPAPDRMARALPLNDPTAVKGVADFLSTRGLTVPQPILTQAFEVDLEGSGKPVLWVCAHSDESAMRENEASAVYAVALVVVDGRPWPLGAQTSKKPASQSIAEHHRFNGTRDFYRWLAFVDLNGDGILEVALNKAQENATAVDVFSRDGKGFKVVLEAYRQH